MVACVTTLINPRNENSKNKQDMVEKLLQLLWHHYLLN